MNTKPTYIDLLTVKVGKRAGVYLEGQVRGDKVFMPLTPDGARQIAADLERAAQAFDAEKKVTH